MVAAVIEEAITVTAVQDSLQNVRCARETGSFLAVLPIPLQKLLPERTIDKRVPLENNNRY
jgi:hypothetical protein